MSLGVRSTRNRWLSVPPETSANPRSSSASASAARSRRSARVVAERGLRRLPERDRDGRGGVVVRPALEAREHRAIDRLGVRALHIIIAAARAAERLVRVVVINVGEPDR